MRAVFQELLDRNPFATFEIVMGSGDRIAIENPAMTAMVESHLTYYPPRTNSVLHLRLNQISLLRVENLWGQEMS